MAAFEYTFKVIVIGDHQVGKTSIIKKYVNPDKSDFYHDIDCFGKKLSVNDHKVKLELWDYHDARYTKTLTRPYYRQTDAVVIVCDIRENLESVVEWKKQIDAKSDEDSNNNIPPVILFVNKKDLNPKTIDPIFNTLCEEIGIKFWFYTSATDNYGINEGFEKLVQLMINNHDCEHRRHPHNLVDISSQSSSVKWSWC